MPIFSAPHLHVDGRLTGPGALVVEHGRITEVLDHVPAPGVDHVALGSGILSAGLVDVQVNGFAGVDMVAAEPEGWDLVRRRLARTGVTAFVPTYITAPVEVLAAGLDRARSAAVRPVEDGARVLGVHLEGPFLSTHQHGAHDASLMRDPDAEAVETLLDAGAGVLAIVTLAPERAHALDAVRRLTAAGVTVSLGHTDADAATAEAAADAGARMVTHVFNAMLPLHHRRPGVAGEALSDERFHVGLIADLQHVAASVCGIIFRSAPGRVVLVTDAIAATGMPPGTYELGGEQVVVAGGDALPRRLDGTIAGSALTLDTAVRNMVACGVDAAAALDAATRVPAQVLRRTDVGVLAPGAHADLVWWSDGLIPQRVWVGGHEVDLDHPTVGATA